MFHVDRFKPTAYGIFTDEIRGHLDSTLFPTIHSDASSAQSSVDNANTVADSGFKGSGSVYQFKKFQPSWASKKLIGTAVGQDDWRKNGPRIIILVLGGLSLVESRAAYEISKKYKRQVFIGMSIYFWG